MKPALSAALCAAMCFTGAQGTMRSPRQRAAHLQTAEAPASDELALEPPAAYWWPHARGRVGAYGTAQFPGPAVLDNASVSWSWHHPEGRFHTIVVGGPLLDDQQNVYIASEDGFRKFSREGAPLWYYPAPAEVCTCPSIMDGALYGSTKDGRALAIDMASGKLRWSRQLAENAGGDTAYVEAHDGRVVLAVEAGADGGNRHVFSLNATDGSDLWNYRADDILWNFMAVFTEDGAVVFMNEHGGVYKLDARTGTVRWYTPPREADRPSFSDGGVLLGPDGTAFGCSNLGEGTGQEGSRGVLRALTSDDGHELWRRELPHPCNSWPAVAPDGSMVVVPVGSFPGIPSEAFLPQNMSMDEKLAILHESLELGDREQDLWHNPSRSSGVVAFDARTGRELWKYEAPPSPRPAAAGDEEGVLERLMLGHRAICLPAPWSSPTIASDGTVYVGHDTGDLYALSPQPGGDVKVSTIDLQTAYLHPGTSFAPGLMAVITCDSLVVFRT